MKAVVLVFSFFFFGTALEMNAQIGIGANYRFDKGWEWVNKVEPRTIDGKELDFGVDYHFKLPNNRIEFLPGISFGQTLKTENEGQLMTKLYGVSMPIRVYPLDFYGDCNCPTWSNNGDLIKKGFYVVLTPSFYAFESDFNNENISSSRFWGIAPGIGLDIGLSKHFTLNPQVSYEIGQRGYLYATPADGGDRDNMTYYRAVVGLRLQYHFKS